MTILPRGVGIPSSLLTLDRVSLRFGPIGIEFVPWTPGVEFSIDASLVPFSGPLVDPPTLSLECAMDEIHVPSVAPRFTTETAWETYPKDGGGEVIIFRGGLSRTPVWQLDLNASFSQGRLTEAPLLGNTRVRANGHPLLEFLVARLLGRNGGVLIHASIAIVDGGSYVFVGHSGAGKSTMAAIAEAAGAVIPTDDRTVIAECGGSLWAWGTPWHGSLVRKTPAGAPIRAVYLLQQAAENRLEPLPLGRAVPEFFVRLVQPRLHSKEILETLRVLERLVTSVPVAVLHFQPNAEAFALATSGIE